MADRLRLSKTAVWMGLSIICLYAVLLTAGLLVGGVVYPFEPAGAYVLGLTLGCALSLGKVVLLEKAIALLLDMGQGPARWLAVLQTLLRYLLTAGLLAAAFSFPATVGRFGAIFGVLTLPAGAYIAGFLHGRD